MSANLPAVNLVVARLHCGNCGRLHLLDLVPGVGADDVLQARWCDGWAEVQSGGWLCPTCIGNHAQHDLREAAEVVRKGHERIRITQKWSKR